MTTASGEPLADVRGDTVKKPLLLIALWAVLLVQFGCSTLTPADDPVYLKLNDIEARLLRIEKVVQNESLIQLATDLQQLQADTQELRGEIETLKHDTETSADRQRELYVDVDRRLQALEPSIRTSRSRPRARRPACTRACRR